MLRAPCSTKVQWTLRLLHGNFSRGKAITTIAYLNILFVTQNSEQTQNYMKASIIRMNRTAQLAQLIRRFSFSINNIFMSHGPWRELYFILSIDCHHYLLKSPIMKFSLCILWELLIKICCVRFFRFVFVFVIQCMNEKCINIKLNTPHKHQRSDETSYYKNRNVVRSFFSLYFDVHLERHR